MLETNANAIANANANPNTNTHSNTCELLAQTSPVRLVPAPLTRAQLLVAQRAPNAAAPHAAQGAPELARNR